MLKITSRIDRDKLGLNKPKHKYTPTEKAIIKGNAIDFRKRKLRLQKWAQTEGGKEEIAASHPLKSKEFYADQLHRQQAELMNKDVQARFKLKMNKKSTRLSLEPQLLRNQQLLNKKSSRKDKKFQKKIVEEQASEEHRHKKELKTIKNVNVVQLFFSSKYRVGSKEAREIISYDNPIQSFFVNETGAWNAYTSAKNRVMYLIKQHLQNNKNMYIVSCLSNLINEFYLSYGILYNTGSDHYDTRNLRVDINKIRAMSDDDWPTMKDLTEFTVNRIRQGENKHIKSGNYDVLHRDTSPIRLDCLKMILGALHKADLHRGRTTQVNPTLAKQILKFNYNSY